MSSKLLSRSSPIARHSMSIPFGLSTLWVIALAESSVLVSTHSFATFCARKPFAIWVSSFRIESPIRTMRLPLSFATSVSLGGSNSSPSVTERSNLRPPDGWKVSPLTMSSARWKTVDSPTCSSVGILWRWRRLRMPVSICSACFDVSAKSKKGAGASMNVPRNCSRCSSLRIPARTRRVMSFAAIPMCMRYCDELPMPPESRIFSTRRATGLGRASISILSTALLASDITPSASKPADIPAKIAL